ncbi:MAG: DNA repair protein RecN [Tannerella sp.]|jgi:DNA repair protein RecN (Recombination protein N)|nr:DNA repair protein RecN [Tannerella sp.]
MLKSLVIRNYVLIDELDISFDNGFSVITGETGAGKSIILGALSLALGERADSSSIRSGSDKCVIEATFDVSNYGLQHFFADNDLDYNASECLFRRELYATGRSRAFINDIPVALSIVKELGNRLLDVHSQHQNLMLSDTHFQLKVVDIMAHNESLLVSYSQEYDTYMTLSRSLEELQEKARLSRKEEDYLRFLHNELITANIQSDEQQALEEELETLSHSEEIKTALYRTAELLGNETISAISSLKEALGVIKQIISYYPKAADYCERLNSALIEIDDIARETDILKEDIEFSPERLEFVNQRLQTIYNLLQKHNVRTVSELIAIGSDISLKINELDSFDEAIADLEHRRQASYELLISKASEITTVRRSASKQIEKLLVERMLLLGMPKSHFQIQLTPKSKPSPDGMDEITFLFSANKNETLKPVAQTASGGEISRLMLCVKAMIAGYSALPSIIFDEIDTGVSGEIADKMAGIMQELGVRMQVLTITHLPQIAAKGKAHYFVYKEETSERTLTKIRRLTADERTEEIARMLSGSTLTKAAIDNAKALIEG